MREINDSTIPPTSEEQARGNILTEVPSGYLGGDSLVGSCGLVLMSKMRGCVSEVGVPRQTLVCEVDRGTPSG